MKPTRCFAHHVVAAVDAFNAEMKEAFDAIDQLTFVGPTTTERLQVLLDGEALIESKLKNTLEDFKKRRAAMDNHRRDTCTHRYPDGKTAWDGSIMYSECKICGVNDL